jgi:GT2 family glycosyltransferase
MTSQQAGVVAIGRNEGERLRACLQSLVGRAAAIVYVDSGSTDGSVALARSLGAEVVELDLAIPFTAARARNAGFERLREIAPGIEFVQFVDGDCEVRATWIDDALAAFAEQPRWGIVCGRRRERRPEASVFNKLCDIEWDTPVGEASACGGDALVRVAAFIEVGGFDPSLIAGEEPEMCVRMRRRGWSIQRLPLEMTLHDAAMTRLGQWWKRTVRAGHAYAEGAARHGASAERHWARESRSIWIWGLIVPAVALALAWPTHGLSLLLFAGYGVLAWRVFRHCRRRGLTLGDAARYAAFTTLGKFPGVVGQMQYHWNRLLRRRTRLIEYKGAAA